MSLINQMFKDLEQRGAWNGASKAWGGESEATFDAPIESPAANDNHHTEKKGPSTFLKISGLLILLYLAVYFWIKNPSYHQLLGQFNPIASNQATTPTPATPLAAPNVAPQTPENQQVEANNLQANAVVAENTPNVAVNPVQTTAPVPVMPQKQAETQHTSAATPNIAPSAIAEMPKKASKAKRVENITVDTTATVPDTPLASNAVEETKPSKVKQNTAQITENVGISKQVRPEQKSASFYQQALGQLQQGRVSEAQSNLALALQEHPGNQEARQTLAALLLDNKRMDDAKNVLKAGLDISPENVDFRMAVARLQVETGDKTGALNTLNQGIKFGVKDADYQGFYATLLQGSGNHEEAINHYNAALNINGNASNFLIGQGISLQALGRFEEAQASFTRAQASGNLTPDLAIFVDQRLKLIKQKLGN